MQVIKALYQAHTFTTAADCRLDHQWPANTFGLSPQGILRLIGATVAWEYRHTNTLYKFSRGMLIAHRRDSCRSRTNENQACLRTGPCKIIVLGQETKSRMNGIGSRSAGGADDCVNHEIRFAGRRWAYMDSLICHVHVPRMCISV